MSNTGKADDANTVKSIFGAGTGGSVMEVIAIAISLLLFLCLLGWGILLLVVGLQETGGILRSLFVGRALLRAIRSPIRFRLRTMLLAAALVQALFATVAWQQREGGTFEVTVLWLAGVSFILWLMWVALEEFFDPTTSQRWKRVVRSDRVSPPGVTQCKPRGRAGHVEPPPRIVPPGQHTTQGD